MVLSICDQIFLHSGKFLCVRFMINYWKAHIFQRVNQVFTKRGTYLTLLLQICFCKETIRNSSNHIVKCRPNQV